MDETERQKIIDSHMRFAQERGSDKTYCPSEVARELYDDWREKMDEVRKIADQLVMETKLYVLQKGSIQDKLPSELKGPIRLRTTGNKDNNSE